MSRNSVLVLSRMKFTLLSRNSRQVGVLETLLSRNRTTVSRNVKKYMSGNSTENASVKKFDCSVKKFTLLSRNSPYCRGTPARSGYWKLYCQEIGLRCQEMSRNTCRETVRKMLVSRNSTAVSIKRRGGPEPGRIGIPCEIA
eukprot:COSAG02_NODE_176_length_31159_cov_30.469833_11_plen_142_part_00